MNPPRPRMIRQQALNNVKIMLATYCYQYQRGKI
jgi:hypothetical protein